ncbi:MAG: haloalkane dehalogenase [Thermoleophilaceae bacterium]|jgi:haloalkane dehalogenase|nr:haloalkane dehalogenase [Thermoleophilaceae bacterium]
MTGSLNGDFAGTFPYESRFVSAGDVSLHYVDEGPPEAAPLLFVHGNPTWSYLWRRQIAELSSKGHRCVAFDHMGFGRSDKPPQLSAYPLERHVANAVALIDALDLHDVTLVGHDWGGPIGLGAVLDRGDRLSRIVLMNTWAWELPSFLPPFLREFRTDGLGEILALGGNLFVESIPGGMHRRDTDPVMMEAYRAPFPDYWSRAGTLAFQREIPLTERDRSAPVMASIHERLADVDVPVLLVWGMRDPVFQPVFLEQWQELFPKARTVELPEASHFLVEDDPDGVTGAIEGFLR